MSAAKHTPRAWSHDGSGNITDKNGQPIAFANWTAYDEGQANASLIAYAPDLLFDLDAACEQIEDLVSRLGGADPKKATKQYRATIAKATTYTP